MIHCVRLGTEVRETELFGLVAGLFGHRRQTAVVKERLRRVADRAVADGHLSRVDDSSYVIG